MNSKTGSAPGRLDLLGGVADYSGALVLEMPTRQSTEVVAEPDAALVVGPAVLSVTETARLAGLDYADVRRALDGLPRWAHYVLGVAVVLVRHGVITPPQAHLRICSDLPQSVGVASSAALEVATARALGAGALDPLRLASLCQEAENYVVGASCGVMDQVAVAQGSAAPCSRSCAGRRQRRRRCPCRLVSRSSAGRLARCTTSAAHRTVGRGRQPSWGRGWWSSPRGARGPG
jgi:galactokinase